MGIPLAQARVDTGHGTPTGGRALRDPVAPPMPRLRIRKLRPDMSARRSIPCSERTTNRAGQSRVSLGLVLAATLAFAGVAVACGSKAAQPPDPAISSGAGTSATTSDASGPSATKKTSPPGSTGGSTEDTGGPGTTKRSAKVNADVTNCGTIDGLSGWPTTM